MSEEALPEEINFEEQYKVLTEECKKLKIDISSLQLSNRSLVNQNRDEKKKVMDCRLQIADLEGRLKSFDATKQDLTDCQAQIERLRMTLESNEAKLADAERRADESSGLIKIKDSVISKQSNFIKEIEERLRNTTEERDQLLRKSEQLEIDLSEALIRGEDCDDLREKLKSLELLFDKLASERSDTTTESGLAAANEYFKAEQAKAEERIAKLKESKADLEKIIGDLENDKKEMQSRIEKQLEEYNQLNDKCSTMEARIKEMAHAERRFTGGMMGSRLIGPTLPPWITDEKKIENDIERLSKADPATLRAKVMELESQLSELNQLLTYREDVILRIHEEISKKASKLEAAEVEKSSLNAQVSILKRELSIAREDLARRGAGPMELEAEIDRLRGKRDREYQRRKRIEAELDELEKENHELKQRCKRLEEAAANAPPKPVVPQSDPVDRNRIIELQGTVNQLRMDNEAKRSELFDLRSKFDSKSAQMDKIASELKVKEKSTGELTAQLNSIRSQLESTTKELESVRCRAVRGGAEVERWHSDLTSLQVTNKFLSSQLNEMRTKLLAKERLNAELTKRCREPVAVQNETDNVMVNGLPPGDCCFRCGAKLDAADSGGTKEEDGAQQVAELQNRLTDSEQRYAKLLRESNEARELAEQDKSQLECKLTSATERAAQLSDDVLRERRAVETVNARVQHLTSQVNELETTLSSTRTQLIEAQSGQRKADIDALASAVSPPAKRTRRSAGGAVKNNTNHQECTSCMELRKQVQELEKSVNYSNSREVNLINEVNCLRQEIADAGVESTQLRSQLTSVREELVKKSLQ
ncbi:Ribosome binding protein 1 [Fasciola gigantica]|uniref:Ribosome binding protein 1 n=1 Tax=Fasciola gigantica TaxID=46835 RepID=A0A504XM72_FASGI|nr:Ribosome binding protein 1 [Fasciola gigantica]